MLIVQISDLHIVEEGQKTLGVAPMAENLAKAIAHINQLKPAPDLVLVTGDITNNANLAQTIHAKQLLSELKFPWFVVPGNHDGRQYLLEVFDSKTCQADENGMINFTIEDYPVRLIGMDSIIPRDVGGELCQKRLDWLQTTLARESDKPTMIFLHHPPVRAGVLESDFDGFIGHEKLGRIIEKHSNIERIICGHIHLPTHTRWHGTIVSTAPSMGMQLGLDLTMEKPSEFFLVPPAFQLHHYTKNQNLVTHTVYVSEMDGPHSFG